MRPFLAPLGALLWLMAVAVALAGTVGGIWVAGIAHPIQGAPGESAPTGLTHPYVTLGIAIVFVALVVAAAVAAVAWAMRRADGLPQ